MTVKFTDAEHACNFGIGENALGFLNSISDFTVEYTCSDCGAVWEYSYRRREGKWTHDRNCTKRSDPEWVKDKISELNERPGRLLNRH